MKLILVGLVMLLIAALCAAVKQKKPSLAKPVFIKKALMTPNELEFFWRLRAAAPEGILVLPQVAMAGFVAVQGGDNKRRQAAFNSIASKRVDYLIFKPSLNEILGIVELDDKTHDAVADKRRDSITESAGITTTRFHSKAKPSIEDLKSWFASLIARHAVQSQLARHSKEARIWP